MGGPADGWSHAVANRLVGNPPEATAFEITLLGPRVRFTEPVWFALAGAPFDARLGEEREYAGAWGNKFTLFPGSALALCPSLEARGRFSVKVVSRVTTA